MKRLVVILALAGAWSIPAFAGSSTVASKAAASTASPYATQIGVDVMRNGGNAIDAAVAIAFALQVAYPQAGNLGGGGFLVYYEAKTGAVWTLDFRECAPQRATPTMFADRNGKTKDAVLMSGPLSVAVPGGLAGLEEAHRRFGSLPWKSLVEPAVRLAHEGVRTNSELTDDLAAAKKERQIDRFENTADRFYPGGKPLPPGSHLLQPELAETLERIADKGASEVYRGPTARRIVRTLAAGGGLIGYHDLDSYRPLWRAPIRIDYGPYQIYTVGPPSGGGLVLAESLAILGGYDLASFGFQTPRAIHMEAEAERRAFLDRNKYVGDPASIHVPFRELASDDRARLWRASIDLDRATATQTLNEPGNAEATHTTHFSVADPSGNVVAMTTTLDSDFGSGMMVDGIFLNDAMSEFTLGTGPASTQLLSPNSIAPGRRMASSMTPTIVLRDNKPFLALGSKGGALIPTSVLQVFLNIAVYHKTLDDAIAATRFHHQGTPDEILYEKGVDPIGLLKPLTIMGHAVRQSTDPIGDVEALMFEGGKIQAVADPAIQERPVDSDLARLKVAAAQAALVEVQDKMIVGLGTGSTSAEFVRLLGARLSDGTLRSIRGVCTSVETERLATSLGIPVIQLQEATAIDVAIDGADEIDSRLRLIKGHGGALLREKIVEQAAQRFVVIADSSKEVERLGRGRLPVEVVRFAAQTLADRFSRLNLDPRLRRSGDGAPLLTDEGHFILDVVVPSDRDIAEVVDAISHNAGVVETGFFPDEADLAIIAGVDGVTFKRRE